MPEDQFKPSNPGEMTTMAINGAMIASLQLLEQLILKMDEHPSVKMGRRKMLINRLKGTAAELNLAMEETWNTAQGDHMNYLTDDVRAIMLVVSIMDKHTRTDVADNFRHMYADFREQCGDTQIQDTIEFDIQLRRVRRDIPIMSAAEFYQLSKEEQDDILKADKELIEGALAEAQSKNKSE